MAKRKRAIPQYGTVTLNGIDYYRTRVQNADGKQISLYATTCEELYEKQLEARRQVEEIIFHRKHPTVDFHLLIEIGKKNVVKKKSADQMKKKHDLETAQIDEIKRRFQKWCTEKCHKFLDSLHLIQTVKEYLMDKDPELVMNDDAFVTMIHAESKLNYWMDILCFGTEEEKKSFFLLGRKEVMELEENLFRAGKEILDRDWSCIEQRMCG